MADTEVSATARSGLLGWLWLLSALFIVYGTTLPFAFDPEGHAAARLAHVGQTTPWALHAVDRLSVPDVVQNILLFVPFGALGVLVWRRRGSTHPLLSMLAVVAFGALLSAGVETLQLFTIDRTSSLTDLATNTAGAFAGALAALLGRDVGLRGVDLLGRSGLLESPATYPMLVFLGVLCLSTWQPFDVTLDVGTVGHKVRLLLRNPWQFNGLDDEGTALLQASLFTGALAAWLSAMGRQAPAPTAAGLAALLVTGLEGSQVLIGARQPGLADGAARVLGCVLGASAWAAGRATGAHLLTLVVALLTAVGAALQMLAPFRLADSYQPVQWIPFFGYYVNTSFDTVSHTIELLLLYLPLGFVLGRQQQGAPPTRTMRTGILLALAVAAPIEYAQGWVVGRYPDVTDVALSVLGAGAGIWAAREGRSYFRSLSARDARTGPT